MIWLLACAQPGAITLVDGRTGQPLDGLPIVAVGADGQPCPEPIAATADGGLTTIPGACARHGWTLRVGDTGWWVPEPPPSADGAAVTAWRVPPTGGLGLLRGTALTPLLTNTAVDIAALTPDDRVLYPVEIPPTLPTLAGDTVLVLDAEGLTLEVLVPGEGRTFGSPEARQTFGPWFYLGARVPAEGPVERLPAPSPAFREVTGGGRTVRYLSASGLPPGRYAILTASRARAVLFEVATP